MVHMPHEVRGKAWKLARPYHGPYRILTLTPSNAEVVLVDRPKDPSLFVSLNRVRPCYAEMGDDSWTGKKKKKALNKKASQSSERPAVEQPALELPQQQGPMTRLKTRQLQSHLSCLTLFMQY